MIHTAACFLAAATLTGPLGGDQSAPKNGTAQLNRCYVKLIDQREVPAREAGVLVYLEAKEGLEVDPAMLLGRTDDTEDQMSLAVARDERDIAQLQAANDVSVRLAEKASLVARMDYDQVKEANDMQRGAVSMTELRGRLFEYERTKLAIEEAGLQFDTDGLTAKARETQVQAAQTKVEHHEIRSPIEGVIVEMYLHEGEWANPGDPIFRVVSLKRLRLEGKIDASLYDRAELNNRPVVVKARLARGREITFQGKVVFVNPEISFNSNQGEYEVWAEVDNRQEGGQWLLLPDMDATVTIELVDPAGIGATPVATPVQTAER